MSKTATSAASQSIKELFLKHRGKEFTVSMMSQRFSVSTTQASLCIQKAMETLPLVARREGSHTYYSLPKETAQDGAPNQESYAQSSGEV